MTRQPPTTRATQKPPLPPRLPMIRHLPTTRAVTRSAPPASPTSASARDLRQPTPPDGPHPEPAPAADPQLGQLGPLVPPASAAPEPGGLAAAWLAAWGACARTPENGPAGPRRLPPWRLLLATTLLLLPATARADEPPEREVVSQRQAWMGVMTQTRVSDRASLWNDAHFVPGGFFIVRTGATAHLSPDLTMSAGYAYLGLPVPGAVTADLQRPEHRPWSQIVYTSKVAPAVQVLNRIRYDMRFRRNIADGALAPGFGLTHRVRFNLNVRVDVEPLRFGDDILPYIAVGDEVLLNFGPDVVFNTLDQNRVIAMLGLRRKRVAGQVGYMNRLVQLPTAHRLVMNHTLVGWLFVTIDARKKERADEEAPRPQ